MNKKVVTIACYLFISILPVGAQKVNSYQVSQTFHIASTGGWDYLALGPVHDWLYVSHGTQVNILNKLTGDSVGIIENTTGVHGIAFDKGTGKGFTSNGRKNSVTVFDLENNKVLAEVPAGQNPDAILYEPFSKKIITCNGRGHNLSIIDPAENKLLDSVEVGGKPETAVSDGSGKLFVNIEDKNEIAVVDTRTFKVIDHWSIAPGAEPTGLAFDPITKRLFAGCDKLLMVIDATTGKVVGQVPIGEGCDGVAFDAASKNIFTSNGGDGTLTVIHEEKGDQYLIIGNFSTKKGARTIALDNQTHRIYLPTADFEAPVPNQQGRPKMIPGSFQVLVVTGAK